MDPGTAAVSGFRIVTYNIHKAKGLDGREKPRRIVEVLRTLKADIIALQEVLSIPNGSREADQGRYIAEELGYNFALGTNRKLRGGLYGNVVLSRFPIRGSCNFDVSVTGLEERGCLLTDVDLPDGQLHVFNVHLGTGFLERRHQVRRLLTTELLRSERRAGPRVVVGDFNEWTRGLTTRMLSAEFARADFGRTRRWGRTYPGLLPFLHLDHVYYDRTLTLDRLSVHTSRLALIASDHLPLAADFQYAAAAALSGGSKA